MAKVLRLTGARVAFAADRAERVDLVVVIQGAKADDELDLSGCLLLPGLINAHDHLEFALFPRLGGGPWSNASEWAANIFHPRQSPVREHLRVPKAVRLAWGGIRNLIAGVTTVCHHNPWEPDVFNRSFPVRVPRRFGWAHSLAFSPEVQERFRATPARWPFIIHAGEGTDKCASAEFSRLDSLGVLTRQAVLIHAVAAGEKERALIARRRASIVWCPSSNLFTLGRTLDRSTVLSEVPVALGTDSALTAEGDLIDEMRVARHEAGLSASEIYRLVTGNAARVLRLDDGVADIIAVADKGQTPAEALGDLPPELVMIGGRVMLVSTRLADRVDVRELYPIELENRGRFLIRADIPRLYNDAARILGQDIRLAGKRVSP